MLQFIQLIYKKKSLTMICRAISKAELLPISSWLKNIWFWSIAVVELNGSTSTTLIFWTKSNSPKDHSS